MKMQHHPAFVAPVLEIVQYMVIMDNVNTIYVLAQYMVYGPHFRTEHDICSKSFSILCPTKQSDLLIVICIPSGLV